MNLIIAIIITDIQWLQSVSRDQVAFCTIDNSYIYITAIITTLTITITTTIIFIFILLKMIINTN